MVALDNTRRQQLELERNLRAIHERYYIDPSVSIRLINLNRNRRQLEPVNIMPDPVTGMLIARHNLTGEKERLDNTLPPGVDDSDDSDDSLSDSDDEGEARDDMNIPQEPHPTRPRGRPISDTIPNDEGLTPAQRNILNRRPIGTVRL
jgi:hypothetical protein